MNHVVALIFVVINFEIHRFTANGSFKDTKICDFQWIMLLNIELFRFDPMNQLNFKVF